MVYVSTDHFHPFLVEATDHFYAEVVAGRHFAPDEEAETIGPVHEDWVFNFLVLATAVDPHSFGEFDVVFECHGGWRCHQSVWPVALVEEESLEVGFAVQSKCAVSGGPVDGSHPSSCSYLVQKSSRRIKQAYCQVVEEGAFRGPECHAISPTSRIALRSVVEELAG